MRLTVKDIISGGAVLAPMAGYGDAAFRQICKDFDAGLTVTEMVSVRALAHKNRKTALLLKTAPNENFAAVQLFGHDAEEFYKVIKDNPLLDKFSVIDINMGCPVKKVVKNGDGAALMLKPLLAAKIVEACKTAAPDKIISVKTRLGFYENEPLIEGFSKALQSAGADFIALHGRYAQQMYRGTADWTLIGQAVSGLKIPVIGNGDIKSFACGQELMKRHNTAGIMIGRAAVGAPWVFSNNPPPSLKDVVCRHIDYSAEYYDKRRAAVLMRKHLHFYLKGVKNVNEIRGQINTIDNIDVLKKTVTDFLDRNGKL